MTGEIYIFICSTILSFFSGMAYVYRTKDAPTFKQVFAIGINTGMAGLGITMIWYYKFSEQIYILLGACILIGLMGPIGVEWVLSQFRKGTFVINFKKESGELNVGDQKNNVLMPAFRFICYTLFLIGILLTDNVFKVSDSKIIAAFMIFSISFEFLVSPIKRGCKKTINVFLTSGIVISGLMLISIYESRKNDYNKERTHLNFIELNER